MKLITENVIAVNQKPERDLGSLSDAMNVHHSLPHLINYVKYLGALDLSAKSYVEKELKQAQIEFDKIVPHHFRIKMTCTAFYQHLGIDPLGDLKQKIKSEKTSESDESKFVIVQEVEAKMLAFDYYEEIAKVLKKFKIGKSL